MPIELFDTAQLVGVRDEIDLPNTFVKNTMFGAGTISFESEEIIFDKINSSRKIAPYVSPNLPGKLRSLRGAKASSFKPAYVKLKNAVSPKSVIKRRPGERMLGELSMQDRFDRITTQVMQDQEWECARREEMMCVEIMRTGRVVIESPDFALQTVDYDRPAAHTQILTGAARWGQAGISPYDTIKAMAQTVHDGAGTHPSVVLMDPKSVELFLKDAQIDKAFNNRRQASGELEFLAPAGGAPGREAVYIGTAGQFEFWQYQAVYHNDAGVAVKVMPDFTVLMGSPGIEGYMTYGAIEDLDGLGMVEGDRFSKMWMEKDPSVAVLLTQSAPLPVPVRIESSACITVN